MVNTENTGNPAITFVDSGTQTWNIGLWEHQIVRACGTSTPAAAFGVADNEPSPATGGLG